MPLGGDVDENGGGKGGGGGESPTAEYMTFVDLQKLCKERNIFPEFLFFESQGSTQRDIRSQERRHRVGGGGGGGGGGGATVASTMIPPGTSIPSSPSLYFSDASTARHGQAGQDQRAAGFHNYGTLSKGKEDEERISNVTFSNLEMQGHWCESGCIIS